MRIDGEVAWIFDDAVHGITACRHAFLLYLNSRNDAA